LLAFSPVSENPQPVGVVLEGTPEANESKFSVTGTPSAEMLAAGFVSADALGISLKTGNTAMTAKITARAITTWARRGVVDEKKEGIRTLSQKKST
jgi:hypothetical protein